MFFTMTVSENQIESSDNDDYSKSVFGSTSEDKLTTTRSTHGRCCKDKTSNKCNNDNQKKKKKKINYPHCKKLGRRQPHPNTPYNKCYWNNSYRGWRPQSICDELEVAFKTRSKFNIELGEWPESVK